MNIKRLNLSVRLHNALLSNRIYTIKDVCALKPLEVLRLENVGRRSLNELQEALGAVGRSLANSDVATISWLKRYRKKLGLSIAQAAKQCEVSPSTWCRWESGETPMPKGSEKLFKRANDIKTGFMDQKVVVKAFIDRPMQVVSVLLFDDGRTEVNYAWLVPNRTQEIKRKFLPAMLGGKIRFSVIKDTKLGIRWWKSLLGHTSQKVDTQMIK